MSTKAQNLDYQVYRADQNSFHVASVLVFGEKEAVLIDAQFTRSDAHKVVAAILESGKKLTTIYVSHGDPDYYFGLEVIKDEFPDALVCATKQTVAYIKKTFKNKLETWGPRLGANGPKNILIPKVLKGDTIKLEGHTIELKGLKGNSAERGYVWIPSLKAIAGGVNVCDNVHLWIADSSKTEDRATWLNALTEMEALKPKIVIAAHALDNSNLNSKALKFSKNYLKTYQKAEPKAKNSETLIATMQKAYPEAGLGIALELGAKVAKGEMKW